MQKQKTLFIMIEQMLNICSFPIARVSQQFCQVSDWWYSFKYCRRIFDLLSVDCYIFFLIKKIITYYRFLVRYLLYYYRFTSMTMTTTRFFWLSQDLWIFLVLSSFIDKVSLPQIKTCNLLFIFLGISKNLDQIVLSTLKEIHCSNNKYLHDPNKVMA